jgi:hypothetical protein
VDTILGKRVKAEDGEEGTVVAVAHVGGGAGSGGWQLLILQEDYMLTAASALNAEVILPEHFVA